MYIILDKLLKKGLEKRLLELSIVVVYVYSLSLLKK